MRCPPMAHLYVRTFILAIILLSLGCTNFQFKYGVAVHPYIDSTDKDMANPLAIVRVEKKVRNIEVVYSHSSSLIKNEAGYGTNYLEFLKCYNCGCR